MLFLMQVLQEIDQHINVINDVPCEIMSWETKNFLITVLKSNQSKPYDMSYHTINNSSNIPRMVMQMVLPGVVPGKAVRELRLKKINNCIDIINDLSSKIMPLTIKRSLIKALLFDKSAI